MSNPTINRIIKICNTILFENEAPVFCCECGCFIFIKEIKVGKMILLGIISLWKPVRKAVINRRGKEKLKPMIK